MNRRVINGLVKHESSQTRTAETDPTRVRTVPQFTPLIRLEEWIPQHQLENSLAPNGFKEVSFELHVAIEDLGPQLSREGGIESILVPSELLF